MVNDMRAWLRLLRRAVDADPGRAQRAVESSQRHDAAILHTLAAVEAELNRPEDAYHTLLEEMDRRGDEGNISGPELVRHRPDRRVLPGARRRPRGLRQGGAPQASTRRSTPGTWPIAGCTRWARASHCASQSRTSGCK